MVWFLCAFGLFLSGILFETLNFSTLKDMLKCLRPQMLEGMFPNFSWDQVVLNSGF